MTTFVFAQLDFACGLTNSKNDIWLNISFWTIGFCGLTNFKNDTWLTICFWTLGLCGLVNPKNDICFNIYFCTIGFCDLTNPKNDIWLNIFAKKVFCLLLPLPLNIFNFVCKIYVLYMKTRAPNSVNEWLIIGVLSPFQQVDKDSCRSSVHAHGLVSFFPGTPNLVAVVFWT